jgi:hypothetical protein
MTMNPKILFEKNILPIPFAADIIICLLVSSQFHTYLASPQYNVMLGDWIWHRQFYPYGKLLAKVMSKLQLV